MINGDEGIVTFSQGDGVNKIVETGVCMARSVACEQNHLAGLVICTKWGGRMKWQLKVFHNLPFICQDMEFRLHSLVKNSKALKQVG